MACEGTQFAASCPSGQLINQITYVLYGRTDSYGYNLHKRAALSLNTIAALLTDPDDEILFVDYNTPDDFPTFPEAIADTLTDCARAQLRGQAGRAGPQHPCGAR